MSRICGLVEGMPLGIVLATSWVKMLNPKAIADEITRNLAFLDVKLQDLPTMAVRLFEEPQIGPRR